MGDLQSMVTSDSMRFVYLDPQGQIRRPFSDLEMHEWYKDDFFPPDLLIRQTWEAEFEPLEELVRRLGNKTKPFRLSQPGPFYDLPSALEQFDSRQAPRTSVPPGFERRSTTKQWDNLHTNEEEPQLQPGRQSWLVSLYLSNP